MKKILYGIIGLFTLFIFISSVNATSSFTLSLTEDNASGNEITLSLKVASLSNFDNGFYGIQSILNYDDTKVEIASVTSTTGFDINYDNTKSDGLVAYSGENAPVNSEILTITVRNIGLSENESTTISLTNIIASDSETDIPGANVTKSLTFSAPTYTKGDMNNNGKIDISDIIILLKKYLGLETTTATDLQIGDMNDDNKLGLQDVIQLLKTYLGIA